MWMVSVASSTTPLAFPSALSPPPAGPSTVIERAWIATRWERPSPERTHRRITSSPGRTILVVLFTTVTGGLEQSSTVITAIRRVRCTDVDFADARGCPLMELPLTGPAWVFFVLAFVMLTAPLVAERLRLPGVVGLVMAGLVVGPEGLGLLAREGTIAQLGGFGLLYLMFLAGLELDLGAVRRDRRPAIVFGLLTFAIPIASGTGVALLHGFSVAASVLIGSLWASHTLVAYPIVRRAGIVSDKSVVAAIGATVITDSLALIVLAVVARSHEAEGGIRFLATLIPGLVVLAMATLWILPSLARWFFTGLGQDRTLRFLFVLVGFLGAAVLAEVVGIEGIVGAFLAGLALNALVPNGGALMQRVEFVG